MRIELLYVVLSAAYSTWVLAFLSSQTSRRLSILGKRFSKFYAFAGQVAVVAVYFVLHQFL